MSFASWQDVEYRSEPWNDVRLARVVDELRRMHGNGGVILKCLRPLIPGHFTEAMHHDLHGQEHRLRSLLDSPSLHAAIEELQISRRFDDVPKWDTLGSHEFEGFVTQLLLLGGAYFNSRLTAAQAREYAREFVDVMCGEKRSECVVFRIHGAWTEWFYDIAWDATAIVLHPGYECWWVLCVTDTD